MRMFLTRPWRGPRRAKLARGSARMSEAKCETGWGDLSTRALLDVERPSPHPAAHFMSVDPRASFARLGPLQGRVRRRSPASSCQSFPDLRALIHSALTLRTGLGAGLPMPVFQNENGV